jgi:hypothetical protein
MVVFSVDAQASNTGAGATVATPFTTVLHPDFVGVFVAWSGAVDVSLADVGAHTWTKKGPTFYVNRVNGILVSPVINVAYFWTIASANLGADVITATFTGAGALNSAISVFSICLANVSRPFDGNAGLGYPTVQTVANSAGFSVPFSTYLNHFIAIGFAILFPDPAGEAQGAGWTLQNTGTATDFGWILESQEFTLIQLSTPADFVANVKPYTTFIIVDAIVAPDATHFPVAEVTGSEAIPVDTANSGEIRQSFDEFLPIANVDESLVIHDLTGADPSGVVAVQQHQMKKNPIADGPETNEYNGEQKFYDV